VEVPGTTFANRTIFRSFGCRFGRSACPSDTFPAEVTSSRTTMIRETGVASHPADDSQPLRTDRGHDASCQEQVAHVPVRPNPAGFGLSARQSLGYARKSLGSASRVPKPASLVPKPASLVPEPASLVPERKPLVPGSASRVPRHARTVPGTRRSCPSASRLYPGTRRLYPGTRRPLPSSSNHQEPRRNHA